MDSANSFVLVSVGLRFRAWKACKYGVISGPYFPIFGLNTGKYGQEITPYLDTFHAVKVFLNSVSNNCFIIYFSIVFNKHRLISIQTFARIFYRHY